ncbi:MAG: hypothetical protein AUH30_10750 [Candidatus Rokubacteria bacterium 13_1_40CM_68_15]|nr:MAG: hypothetical protein AUH30_10750 [Candidatus Rokubacteria bacterium 13_1_40CM_68_15]
MSGADTAASRQTIVRNTFWYGVVTAIGLVAGLLMSVVLARGLGPARMGDYSYLLWLMRTITAVATLGYALATVRYTADALAQDDRPRAGAFLRLFVRLQAATTAIVAALLAPLVWAFAPVDLRWPLLVFIAALFPITLESIYAHGAYGAQRYDLTTRVSTIKMALQLLATILAVALGADILGIVVASVFGTAISCLLQRQRALALYPERSTALPPAALGELRAYLLPLSIVALLDTVVWDRSEVLFLRLYASSEQIAFYSVAFGLASRAVVLPQVVAGTLLPALAALHGRGDRAEFRHIYREAIRGVALVGTPIAAIVAAVAPGLVTLLYGEPYRSVALLLGPLLVVSLVGVMRQVAWSALRAVGDRRWALHATWISAVLNVVSAALLIPWLGVWGAVMANAGAQLLASVLSFLAVAYRHGSTFPALAVLRTGAAGLMAFATAAAVMTHHGPAHVVTAGAVSLAVFVAAAMAVGALTTGDWNLLVGLARRVPAWVRLITFASATVLVVAGLYGAVLRDLVGVWTTNPYYSYGFLVPLFSAWASWDARDSLRGVRPAWSWLGLGLAVAGLALLATGDATGSLTMRALSLPAVLAGSLVLVVGPDRFAALLFPVVFLAFMAPLPPDMIPAISRPLQGLAAWFTAHALPIVGIPAALEGLSVRIPGVVLDVNESCNGLRFLLAMIVIGAAIAWSTRIGALRRLGIVTLAVVVALAANLVRVAGTGWIAHHYGPAAAAGVHHVVWGKVVYVVMLLPFALGVSMLRRRPRAISEPRELDRAA